MAWIPLRSRRDPAFWAPHALAFLFAFSLVLLGQHWSDAHVASLRTLAQSDPEAAMRAFEATLRGLAWISGGLCFVAAGLLGRLCQLGLRAARIPPAGWWSLGAHRAATGDTARHVGRLGLALAVLLALSGVALVLYAEHLIRALAQGR
jgi:hypothetical protein